MDFEKALGLSRQQVIDLFENELDKAKVQSPALVEELMKIFQTYKVSPVNGYITCLGGLVQVVEMLLTNFKILYSLKIA